MAASDLGSNETTSSFSGFLKRFRGGSADAEEEEGEASDDEEEEVGEQKANVAPPNADALFVELKRAVEAPEAPEAAAGAAAGPAEAGGGGSGGGGDGAGVDAAPPPLSDFWLWCALRARKFDVARAAKVARKLRAWRHEMQVGGMSPATHPELEAQLLTGKLRLTGGRDKGGRAILVLNLRHHNPATDSARDMLRLVFYVIEQAHRQGGEATQCRGFCFINDLAGAGWSNMDPRVPRTLMPALQSTIPGRVGKVCILNPPFFFRMVFAVASRFMKKKIRARLSVLGADAEARAALLLHVDADQLLPEHGGTLVHDHAAWVARCKEEDRSRLGLLEEEERIDAPAPPAAAAAGAGGASAASSSARAAAE